MKKFCKRLGLGIAALIIFYFAARLWHQNKPKAKGRIEQNMGGGFTVVVPDKDD